MPSHHPLSAHCRCDGTGPEDDPPDEQAVALLTAGELAAFLAGARGVCLLQLLKGWGDTADGRQQPLLRPWVLTLLQEAAGHKGVALLPSAAPGEARQLGETLVLAARQQPWQAWAKHLAGLGVQARLGHARGRWLDQQVHASGPVPRADAAAKVPPVLAVSCTQTTLPPCPQSSIVADSPFYKLLIGGRGSFSGAV